MYTWCIRKANNIQSGPWRLSSRTVLDEKGFTGRAAAARVPLRRGLVRSRERRQREPRGRVLRDRQRAAGVGQYRRLSSNLHPSGFDELMPKTLATATVDRLMHHAHVCQTSGDSIRLSQALTGKGVMPLSS